MRYADTNGAFSAFGSSDPALDLLQLCRDDTVYESRCFAALRVTLTMWIYQKQKQSAEITGTGARRSNPKVKQLENMNIYHDL